ncbi:MAG: hypothetical protein QM723_05825 [Myxococcaceae bacterium]
MLFCLSCGRSGVQQPHLFADPAALEFGVTWLGHARSLSLEVTNAGTESGTIDVTTAAPFSVDHARLELKAGERQTVAVHFDPTQEGAQTGTLQLGPSLQVALSGDAQREPVCPINRCFVSSFDAVAGVCAATPVADGTPCEGDPCGISVQTCISGQCQLLPRTNFDGCRGSWHTNGPPSRAWNPVAYDPDRDRVVIFGSSDPHALNDTWELDGDHWLQRSPADSPPPLYAAAMAYDSARKKMMLFGGVNAQTWEWDGVNWAQRTPAHSPPARGSPSLGYDSKRQVLVLFGGSSYDPHGGYFNDTWEWDGNDWAQRSPPASPGARGEAGFVFDPTDGAMLLIGGFGPANPATGASDWLVDPWRWDGTTWSQVSADGLPPYSPGNRAYFDTAFGAVTVLAFDGSDAPAAYVHTASGWTPHPSTSALDWTIGNGDAVYDSHRNRVVIFGGYGLGGLNNTTWLLDQTLTWSVLSPAAPPSRAIPAMAYDSNRQVTVMVAGGDIQELAPDGTWEWNGSRWSKRLTVGGPGQRMGAAMVYDSLRDRLVLFGGSNNGLLGDTLEFDGTYWQATAPAHSPPARRNHVMIYDAARHKTVLFGGSDAAGDMFDDTWEWDGTDWTQMQSATHPSGRENAGVAYDAAHQQMVLLGGHLLNAFAADTWVYDASGWTQRFPQHAPAQRTEPALAYDSQRGVVYAYGGSDWTTDYADTWRWDGTDWTLLSPAVSPRTRVGGGIVYDSARDQLVMFGGTSAIGPGGQDTWIYTP